MMIHSRFVQIHFGWICTLNSDLFLSKPILARGQGKTGILLDFVEKKTEIWYVLVKNSGGAIDFIVQLLRDSNFCTDNEHFPKQPRNAISTNLACTTSNFSLPKEKWIGSVFVSTKPVDAKNTVIVHAIATDSFTSRLPMTEYLFSNHQNAKIT